MHGSLVDMYRHLVLAVHQQAHHSPCARPSVKKTNGPVDGSGLPCAGQRHSVLWIQLCRNRALRRSHKARHPHRF
jgi:hypothetical protein